MENVMFEHPRDQIVEIMQRIYGYGMTTTSGGNLSVLDSSGNIWISPASIDKGTLQRDDIVCMTPDGECIGRHRPSSEYPFHRAIYKNRPDIKAILHAHPPALVSFSVAGQIPNTSVHSTIKQVCGTVGYAAYEVPGSEALGKSVSDAFAQGHSTILLENHGACCVGATLLRAFQRFETLDFCARLICSSIQLGKKPFYLSETDIEFNQVDRNLNFHPFIPDIRTSDEMELRYQMALLIRRAYKQKLFTSTEGTFAVRIDKDSFLITPRDIDRGTLQAEDLVLVKGNAYENGKNMSRATWFFKAIFEAQPEINSLIISNPPNIMGYAVSHETFDPRVIPESYILLREVPVFPYGTHFRNLDEVTKTISPRYPVIIIENDCLITSGSNLLQAFDRMEVAEYSAKATISAKALGGLKPITDAQIADLVKAFNLIP
ncbi:MAG: class II aldolase/adducin family protein [Victivallales bacterium]|jgi:L-fuculose-phosphate aldolase|nr:class II aldolase/adducin family protein [Victivallales bacterium]MBR4220169.1 class II aldolase/adducin family protein [Victivallales bacterium]